MEFMFSLVHQLHRPGGRKYCLWPGISIICLIRLTAVAFFLSRGNWQATFEQWSLGRDRGSFAKGVHQRQGRLGGSGDKFLGGLLVPGFDERSCLSRYQAASYYRESQLKPSSYLKSRLRRYEALHKRCAPHTELYNKSVQQIKHDRFIEGMECQYLVWIPDYGLGNKILSLTSAFVYALLTNRVLLIERGKDMADLFCEPFPEVTWLLPLDFPINRFNDFNQRSSRSYGHMLKSNLVNNTMNASSNGSLPGYIYVHILHDYDDHDKLFLCEQDQSLLQKIPWLILRSNMYFVPSLFLIPTYQAELSKLFLEKQTIFYHLSHYLFHPANSVWDLITNYYQLNLSNFREVIGIQIRDLDGGTPPFQYVVDHIFSCISKEKILPDLDLQSSIAMKAGDKSIAILLTSLSSGYYEKVGSVFKKHPTVNGDVISVFQPSHEEFQQTDKESHDEKALAEMYLLSMTDMLLTSSFSTFGYVAHGLGGLTPWILSKNVKGRAAEIPCRRAISMEPCFITPPNHGCNAKSGVDTSEMVPHVRHCVDVPWGLKILDAN